MSDDKPISMGQFIVQENMLFRAKVEALEKNYAKLKDTATEMAQTLRYYEAFANNPEHATESLGHFYKLMKESGDEPT